MTPNELRIGNYVHLGGKNTQIYELYHDFVTTTLDNGNYEYIYGYVEPIPLTEEWLSMLGFRHHPNATPRPNWKLKDGFCLFEWGREFKCIDYKLRETFNTNMGQITHVHQLQNLYFALIGKELTIKESAV